MTLLLSDEDVATLARPAPLIEALEDAMSEEAAGQVVLPARLNLGAGDGFLRIGPAILVRSGVMGFKAFHGRPGGPVRYLTCLYDEKSGELLAILDACWLTAARTGAMTGVATKYLAKVGGVVVGVIGSGLEARANLEAVATVRAVKAVSVYSPHPDRRQRFAEELATALGVEVVGVDSPQAACREAEVVVVATNTASAPDPIAFRGAWMRPGQHVNSIGSTAPRLREIDPEAFRRPDLVVVDSISQVAEESGDVIAASSEGAYPAVVALKDVVSGRVPGRSAPEALTLFKSVGTAVQDVVAAAVVYRAARKEGRGRDLGDVLVAKGDRREGRG